MSPGPRRPLLAIDTATRRCCLALGDATGGARAERTWAVGRRHEETVLPELEALLAEAAVRRTELGGIVAGIGPGAFTGTRIGLAVAKTLAHGLAIPLVGVATTDALALAADAAAGPSPALPRYDVLLPAGPAGRYLAPVEVARGSARALEPPRLVGPTTRPSGIAVAVDLAVGPGIDEAAVARGELAQSGLAAAHLALGAAVLAAGATDDPAVLGPAYVTLPRGASGGGEAWSPDLD